jgi:hypothetical protein
MVVMMMMGVHLFFFAKILKGANLKTFDVITKQILCIFIRKK